MNFTGHSAVVALTLAVSMGLSFLFSGMESGVLALSALRIRQLRRTGHTGARVLQTYLDDPEDFLWTILVGNTVANLTAVSLLAILLYRWLGRYPGLCLTAFILGVFCFYVVCELLPKVVFRAFPNRLCMFFAGFFRYIHIVLKPLVAIVSWISQVMLVWTGGRPFTGKVFGNRDELRFATSESAQGFTQEERTMINRVLDLQSLSVRQIATPLSRSPSVRAETPIREVLAICRDLHYSHLVVWNNDGKRDRVIGVLSIASIIYNPNLDPNKNARDHVQPALFIDEQMRLEDAFRKMQRAGKLLAILVGPDQVEGGIVTMEDVLTAIFGEVRL
jgi:putative hemolysin